MPVEITQTTYGVEARLDLPLIVLAFLLTLAVIIVAKRKLYLLLAAALACFALRQGIFYLKVEPTETIVAIQQWIGTLGWLLLAVFAGISLRRHD